MNLSQRLKRLFRKMELPGIMTYIAATMAVIFIGDIVTGYVLSDFLSFSRDNIIHDLQLWRIFTFLFIPTNYSPLWSIITIVFYHSIGRDIEAVWGSGNLTAYLLTGIILTIGGGFIGGYTTNLFLYLSLFCAYAALMPNNRFMMFFIIPVKAKYLAWADGVIMLSALVSGNLSVKLAVIAALLVFLIFFGGDFLRPVANKWKHRDFIHEMRRSRIKKTGRRGE